MHQATRFVRAKMAGCAALLKAKVKFAVTTARMKNSRSFIGECEYLNCLHLVTIGNGITRREVGQVSCLPCAANRLLSANWIIRGQAGNPPYAEQSPGLAIVPAAC